MFSTWNLKWGICDTIALVYYYCHPTLLLLLYYSITTNAMLLYRYCYTNLLLLSYYPITTVILLYYHYHTTLLRLSYYSTTALIMTGVKQGCVIAPTLFSIFLLAVLHIAQSRTTDGKCRVDGGLFTLKRIKSGLPIFCSKVAICRW